MWHKISIILVALIMFFFGASGQIDTSQGSCASTSCHGNLIKQEVVHDALKRGCDKCHQSNGMQHPQKDTSTFKLAKDIPGLCYKCHDENNTERVVHNPVQKGNCLACHTPHSSPESFLLKKNPTGEVCAQCHTLESAKKRFKHEPVAKGECAKCHEPHQSENDRLLIKPSPALCLKCHKEQAEQIKMENVHPPFQNNCLNCHNQHSSINEKLLDLSPQNLCLYCHDDMQKKMDKATLIHGAIKDNRSCINCHSPHASAQKKFLVKDVKSLCLSCHDRTYTNGGRKITNIAQVLQKSKNIHGAIEKASCIGCHDPHASSNPFLLNKAFPSGSYAGAVKENFAVCFNCHKGDLIEKTTTTTATNFRNGDKNLHAVHINGEKGRSCVICHNPHGSNNDHLINDFTQFGNWNMPLRYQPSAEGGSCAPGCHAERKYERNIAIPEAAPNTQKK
jgi:predicted CXXCH cytochrome family protein